jgi:hypothetical protein
MHVRKMVAHVDVNDRQNLTDELMDAAPADKVFDWPPDDPCRLFNQFQRVKLAATYRCIQRERAPSDTVTASVEVYRPPDARRRLRLAPGPR